MLRFKRAPFYGWAIVAAVFAIFTACSGLTVYALSVYLHAFVAEGRFALPQVAFASGMFGVFGGLAGAWIGRLLDRHDARWIITGGCLLMSVALLGMPWIRQVHELYLFYIVLGIGYSCAALIPGTTLIARWFDHKRAAAMSTASTGNSFGAIVLVPPAALLIEHNGLDGASPWLALILVVGVLPLTWLVLRAWPSDKGLRALGQTPDAAARPVPLSEAVYRAAVRSRYFKGICIAFMLGLTAHIGGQMHLFNLLMARDGNTEFAAMAVALMAFCSVTARLVVVRLIQRWGNRAVMALLLVVQGLALWGCGLVTHAVPLLVCIALYGCTLGSFITQQSLLMAEAFGARAYARVYGTSRVWGVPGMLAGPSLMGWLYQVNGGYLWAYVVVGCISLLGVVAVKLAGPVPAPVAEPVLSVA